MMLDFNLYSIIRGLEMGTLNISYVLKLYSFFKVMVVSRIYRGRVLSSILELEAR